MKLVCWVKGDFFCKWCVTCQERTTFYQEFSALGISQLFGHVSVSGEHCTLGPNKVLVVREALHIRKVQKLRTFSVPPLNLPFCRYFSRIWITLLMGKTPPKAMEWGWASPKVASLAKNQVLRPTKKIFRKILGQSIQFSRWIKRSQNVSIKDDDRIDLIHLVVIMSKKHREHLKPLTKVYI